MRTSLSSCGELIRRHDPDRFLLSMFAPADTRPALWALFAFNHEIAKTRDVVSETQMGMIRLQWWRERIEQLYKEHSGEDSHEILGPLALAIKKYSLPEADFDTLLYAREFDLEDVLPADIEGVLNYADFTTRPLMNLALRIVGDDPTQEPVQAASINYALAGLLRSVVFCAQNRR